MDANQFSSRLECRVVLESMEPKMGFFLKRKTHKKCTLQLIRNQFREIFLRITDKGEHILTQELKSVTVYKRFLTEGRATIKFAENHLNVIMSNAPRSDLYSFLKTICIKIANDEGRIPQKSAKHLSCKKPFVKELSPFTEKDYHDAKMKMETDPHFSSNINSAPENTSDMKAQGDRFLEIIKQPLSEEQARIVQAAKQGYNIFVTGAAGTGKTYVLRSIIAALPPEETFATASTAVAASQIGGTTLHQFAGTGKGQGSMEHLISLASRPEALEVWKKCQHLIIDEISMVHGCFFENLECVARKVRKNEKPFGGIQLIVCGDFFQLPPLGKPVVFCFQTEAWEKCITKVFELKENYRHTDPVFREILQQVRMGEITEESVAQLQKTSWQKIQPKLGVAPTRLCTHEVESKAVNKWRYSSLEGPERIFKASDAPESLSDLIDKHFHAPSSLSLKVGAQVMLLKNLDMKQGLVNGAIGVVVKFDANGLPVVQFGSLQRTIQREKFISKSERGVVLRRIQIPLTVAWAFGIHKSQGLTLDCLEVALVRAFQPGHAYVALSRVKGLDCLRVFSFKSKQVLVHPEVLKFYASFKEEELEENDFSFA